MTSVQLCRPPISKPVIVGAEDEVAAFKDDKEEQPKHCQPLLQEEGRSLSKLVDFSQDGTDLRKGRQSLNPVSHLAQKFSCGRDRSSLT